MDEELVAVSTLLALEYVPGVETAGDWLTSVGTSIRVATRQFHAATDVSHGSHPKCHVGGSAAITYMPVHIEQPGDREATAPVHGHGPGRRRSSLLGTDPSDPTVLDQHRRLGRKLALCEIQYTDASE
jgi:hypothetical protein